jgi:hypothetical protein
VIGIMNMRRRPLGTERRADGKARFEIGQFAPVEREHLYVANGHVIACHLRCDGKYVFLGDHRINPLGLFGHMREQADMPAAKSARDCNQFLWLHVERGQLVQRQRKTRPSVKKVIHDCFYARLC